MTEEGSASIYLHKWYDFVYNVTAYIYIDSINGNLIYTRSYSVIFPLYQYKLNINFIIILLLDQLLYIKFQ